MTHDDSTRVLERLKGGWAKHIPDDTFAIWLDELDHLDFSPAYAAARTLIRRNKYFPAISEFLDAYATHERDQRPHVEHTACIHCDHGFVLVDHATNAVAPCSVCHADQWEAWTKGGVPRTDHRPNAAMFTPRIAERQPEPEWVADARRRIDAMRDVLVAAATDQGAAS